MPHSSRLPGRMQHGKAEGPEIHSLSTTARLRLRSIGVGLDTMIPGACGMRLGTNDSPNQIHNVARIGQDTLDPDVVDVNFLITATELQDRKAKRRKHSRSRVNRLLKLGLKAKGK
jgi:hypothetical protein